MGMLVDVAVGTLSVGVRVSVGGTKVGGTAVSVKVAVDDAMVIVAGAGALATGAAEGSVQAESRKISTREVV